MIGVVIADDEKIIRDGLMTIDWETIGVEVRGVCENGNDAFDALRISEAGILLTDIRMPGMNGIELIQKVKEVFPKVKTILLTGYGEFEYARAAIAAGSVGYILKPTNPEEVLKAVEDAKKLIEKENTVEKVRAKLEKQVKENEINLKEKFLFDVMSGNLVSPIEIYDMSIEYDIRLFNYHVMLIECERREVSGAAIKKDEGEGKLEKEYTKLTNCINDVLNRETDCYVVSMNYCTICIVYNINEEKERASNYLQSFCQALHRKLEEMLQHDIYIGVSSAGGNFGELRSLYDEAKYCLDIRYIVNNPIIYKDNLSSNSGVEKIIEYIYTNYMEDISLTSCAEYVHLNPIYITRLIRKQTGVTFLDILTKVRMTKAIEMLKHPDIKMNEVSSKVGINDSRYFSQVFKKHYGVTPTEYRNTLIKSGFLGA